jgi:hypothetical protein
MDSLCGAGVHGGLRETTRLASVYTGQQRSLQRQLAAALGYSPPSQLRLGGRRGKEGFNLVRSFMFLSVGALVAESYGAERLYQYENGVLALAIPPSGFFLPTRHAHPVFHSAMEALFQAVFDRGIKVINPFLGLTKREAVETFERKFADQESANTLLLRSQTCWNLVQAQANGGRKRPMVPCGVCTPCIVRLTARPQEWERNKRLGWRGYRFDLRLEKWQRHARYGRTFEAYLELIDIVLSNDDDYELVRELAPEAREFLGLNGVTISATASILRRFAHEFCDTFHINVER